jgi:hypothetical protein
MFNPEDSLTHEEVLLRFKKLFNRDMSAAEKYEFFLPSETSEPDEEKPRRRRST